MPKKKVLVVDDEEGICEFMQDLLERKGCQVFTALDTAQALEIFNKERPGACVLDVHMPYSKFDGVELLRRIREVDKDVLCIMLSRIDSAQKVEEAKKLGVEKYYFKPLVEGLNQLIEEIAQ